MTRDWTVATFVVKRNQVLLLWHRKLRRWLPPGGHIEPGELPDEAAVREVREEAGIEVELVGRRALPLEEPRQLLIPQGLQLERIAEDHEHIDLVYFARPLDPEQPLAGNGESERLGWYGPQELERMELTHEIRLWVRRALEVLGEGEPIR